MIKMARHPITISTACKMSAATLGILMALLLSLNMVSCKKQSAPEQPQKESDTGFHKSYERGPLFCTVDADKSEMTIADRLHLTITAVIDENYDVELPAAGEKLAQFGIVDYHTSAPELTQDHKKKISRSYVLEPFLSGDYAIPAMTVRFWKSGEEGKDDHSLQTEELTIKVKSLLPENFKDMKLHDIRPPVTLPRSISLWVWVSGSVGMAVICGLIFFAIIKRRNQHDKMAVKSLPAHEVALNELEKLIAQRLVEKGEIKLFYYEITHILRTYIENRFGINAPEQTTEEFLDGLRTNSSFPENSKGLLKNFLLHCDLVKFAAHHPTTDDIQNTFNSCKIFISETKIKETV